MEVLRTPDERFDDLKEYPFEPHYTNIKTHDGTTLRIHHIDEGPKDGPILLAMHGQPVWSYLYARMIPFLVKAGIRVIAPDLPGYGKSDKPAAREDYSYQNQVDWMGEWLKENNFLNLTFFGQDWGGLIGLRMVAQDPDRFIKVSMGNTGLPYNPDVPQEVIEKVKEFRASNLKLTPMSMQKEVMQMDGKNLSKESSPTFHPSLKFMYWQKFCWDTENLPVGFINSTMMEKRSKISMIGQYLFENLGFHLDIKTIIKISGSNGSGKTTFLKNIAGILKNYEGNIYFKDKNIKDTSFPNIFYTGHRNGFKNNLTIKENLNNDLRARDLNLNNVKKYFSSFGCDISFSSLLGNYSEGQKKKVLLSLLAASQADLYVLDEPFSNLDAKGIDYLNQSNLTGGRKNPWT